MYVNEAKNFLVQQVAEQARREGIPLSDLEKRMMQFTENSDAVENPIELNDEFEKHHDTSEFERKIATLLAHAYRRLQQDSPRTAETWDLAVKKISKGDHYILVMWDMRNSFERPRHYFWKVIGGSFLVATLTLALVFGGAFVAQHYNLHWQGRPTTHTSFPKWLQRSLLIIMVGAYVIFFVRPAMLNGATARIDRMLTRVFGGDTPEKP